MINFLPITYIRPCTVSIWLQQTKEGPWPHSRGYQTIIPEHLLLLMDIVFQDHMSSTNIIVKVEDVDDDKNDHGDGDDKTDNDIDELVVPLPPVDSSSSSSHDNNDKDDEPAVTSLHELSISPDHHQKQDDITEKPTDQSSSTLNDTPPEGTPDQTSIHAVPQEQFPPSADDTNDNTNLLTSI